MKIRNFLRTCIACPSQWDAVADDGRAVYIRYRGGLFQVRVARAGDTSEYAAVGGECIVRARIGGEYDGFLADEELFALLRERDLLADDATAADNAMTRDELEQARERAIENLDELLASGVVKVLR